jgi:prenyltransferase beta subunit
MFAKPDGGFMTKRHQADVLRYVMARWRHASGGFGFTPTLPASVEDTYHALGVLEKIGSIAKNEINTLKGESNLGHFLIKASEEKENWKLKTAYHYVSCCAFAGLPPGESWLRTMFMLKLGQSKSLQDHYYASRIAKEWVPQMKQALPEPRLTSWRTSGDLWMVLYLHDGDPEQFLAAKEDLVQWLQACQNSDGGFGFLPGSTSFIENGHWCLASLALLGSAPLMRDSAIDFILRSRTKDGGFSRRNGGAPFLYATWHAVLSLALLSQWWR